MNRFYLFFSVLFLLSLLVTFSSPSSAKSDVVWGFSDIHTHPTSFFAGFAAGILFHELGHITVASVKGYQVGVDNFTIVYPHAMMTRADSLQVSSAGFQAQWLLSEVVLQSHELAKDHRKFTNAEAGLVCSHLTITAAYLLILKNQPKGDITGISQATGLSRDTITVMVCIPAALDYWRLTGHHVPRWVPALSATSKGLEIAAVWHFH